MIEGLFDKVVFQIFSICQFLKMYFVYSSVYYMLLGFGWFLEQCMGDDIRHAQIPSRTNIPANDHKEFMKSYKTNNQTQNIKCFLKTKPLNIYFHVLAIKQIETMKILKPGNQHFTALNHFSNFWTLFPAILRFVFHRSCVIFHWFFLFISKFF